MSVLWIIGRVATMLLAMLIVHTLRRGHETGPDDPNLSPAIFRTVTEQTRKEWLNLGSE